MNHKLKNERFRRRLVSILSCIVVFCTTYALILPAVTLERDDIVYYCGKEEHQHTDECYESPKDRPLCGLKDGEMVDGHVHDESCYKTEMVLDCLEDHEHTDECYKEEKTLVCDKEEGAQEHKHSSKCFLSTEPLCGKEVHTHSRECESNKGLKETKEDWEHSIPAKLKDTSAERMVQIALSQKDYKEVKENFELDEEGHEQYYTRYGEWYGRPYEDWNVMFVSFVLRYAGIKNEQIPYGHDWNEWIEDLTKKQLFADEGYMPKDGDLIFIKDKEDENVPDKEIRNYAGIVTDIENRKIVVGDLNGQVKEITLDDKEYETNAYVAMIETDAKDDVPADKEESNDNETNKEERPDEEAEEEVKEEETDPIEFRMPEQFEIENEDFTLTLTPRVFDEDAQEDNEEQTEENSEETNEEGLKIKKFSLNEENIQDKIDAENELTKEELEQITQANEEQKKEDEDKPLLTVQLEKIDEQAQTSEEEQAEIEQLKEQSLENVDQDNLLDLSFYKLRFFANDQEVDLKDQKFDAELTPTEQFVEKYDTTKDLEDVAPEAEVGTQITVHQASITFEEIDSLLESNAKLNNISGLYQTGKDIAPVSFVIKKSCLSVSAIIPGNPQYTVQTYAYVQTNKSDSGDLQIFDMSNGHNVVSSAPTKKYKIVNRAIEGDEFNTSQSVGEIEKGEAQLVSIFGDVEYYYHSHPTLKYMDRLTSYNQNYEIKEVWENVTKEEYQKLPSNKKKETTENNRLLYWRIESSSTVQFTNNIELYNQENALSGNYIYIENDTILRLVYKPSLGNFTSSADFYDYDITNGKTDGKYWTNINGLVTGGQGINSNKNYQSNNGNRLAFGNANTGVGFHDQKHNGTLINKAANPNGIDKNYTSNYSAAPPVPNLVGNTLENGQLIYNVDSPKLFGESDNVTGKTSISGANLRFSRLGDTYTLTDVTGSLSASGLNTFNHPKCSTQTYSIYTNNFWPLDSQNGKDGKTGGNVFGSKWDWKSSSIYYSKVKYSSQNSTSTADKFNYPASDDGIAHNNMFGMTYEIQFELDKDYKGPLDYFFFGDDDLWAYLIYPDNSSEKIIDLGGVHSTFGAYVNLRDKYLTDEKINLHLGNNQSGKFKLKLFYTERGLSGSSCYLQFTLPKVSGISTVPKDELRSVKISKKTEDFDYDTPYRFSVELKNGTGNPLTNQYPVSIYDSSNLKVDSAVVTNGGQIQLKKNQYAVIENLPKNTQYRISEVDVDANTKVYISHIDADYGNPDSDHSMDDFVSVDQYAQIYFKNVRFFELPETGSLGISPPLMAGGASVMTTSIYAITLQRKGRWRKRKR